jgi:hypothetical protein
MKITFNDFLNENKLFESLTDIVYHFTHVFNLIDILKENVFYASTNLGSSSDLSINKNKFYFFSTTRSKSTGYNIGNVKLVLDGRKLNQKYKGFPIDYWKYSKNPKDYGDVQNNPSDKAAYKRALLSGEQEDRIALDDPEIKNATSYILEVHILLEKYFMNRYKKSQIKFIIDELNNYNIPVYFYQIEKDYLLQNKKNIIDPLTLEGFKDEHKEDYVKTYHSKLYFLDRIAALLCYKDANNFNKLIKELELNEEDIEKLKKQIKNDTYNYYQHDDKFTRSEFNNVIKSEIHNRRSDHDKITVKLLKILADDLKKLGTKTILEYIDKKLEQINEKFNNINDITEQKLTEISKIILLKYPQINYGGCAVFAKAFHDVTNLPYILIIDDSLPEEDPPIHVMIKLSNDKLYDAEGIKTKAEIKKYWNNINNLNIFEEDLTLQGKILFLEDEDGSILDNYYNDFGGGFCFDHKDEYNNILKIIKKILH